jgi:sarcosine oxidase subunit gamma
MPVSAPEVGLGACPADVVEIAARAGRAGELRALAASAGLTLPAFGRIARAGDTLALCVRPERWLLLTAPATPAPAAARWRQACAGVAAAIELSSGLAALHLAGPNARELLTRGCRLNLDPELFAVGHAAATIMAQVASILVAVTSGILILTPASTARHLREWLAEAAHPLGLAPRADVTVAALLGDPHS